MRLRLNRTAGSGEEARSPELCTQPACLQGGGVAKSEEDRAPRSRCCCWGEAAGVSGSLAHMCSSRLQGDVLVDPG